VNTVCDTERDKALVATPDGGVPDEQSVRRTIQRAVALSRFQRTQDAVALVDRAAATVSALPSVFSATDRANIDVAFKALRACIVSSAAPPMATLSVRVRTQSNDVAAGAYVRVEDVPVGRTSSDGRLKAQVPSGLVRLTAVEPSRSIGYKAVILPAGGTGDALVEFLPGRDVVEDTNLVIEGAHDRRIPATSASLTLQFVRDGQRVPMVRLERIEYLTPAPHSAGGAWVELRDACTIVDGAIRAVDVRRLAAALPRDDWGTIRLRVRAVDAAGFTHVNWAEFSME
jgi:hypothetical protein